MKKLWFGISLFLFCISMANFFQIFNDKKYSEFSLAIIVLGEILIDIFLALYITLIFNEFIIKKVYKCKLLYSYKFTKYTKIIAMVVLIILYTGKNISLIYHIPEYFIMLLYLLTLAYSFIAISTKINNLYMNDSKIFIMKFDKYIEFSKIINYKLNMLPLNIYQLEIKTTEDEFKFNLSKNTYQAFAAQMRTI
ncbi:hypothetical protein [Anaerocolumna sp.]|uniref:hypothetical protein n=1 Tax=Anaerocolumna sp. TaxID=2041569 RepID=UPI0028A99ADA|nr:hypothetical protein [Anaerocolumna sp.]